MGEPLLFEASLPVTAAEFSSPELNALIQDMKATMQARNGVGIAAPQIGCNKRVIMFGFDFSPRYPNEKPIPFTILINPEIEPLSDELVDGWEGCLSVPGLRGSVPRYKNIKYTGFDETGKRIEQIAENFHARVIQHELDHINGVLFPQRISDFKKFGFEDILFKVIYR